MEKLQTKHGNQPTSTHNTAKSQVPKLYIQVSDEYLLRDTGVRVLHQHNLDAAQCLISYSHMFVMLCKIKLSVVTAQYNVWKRQEIFLGL